MNSGTHTNMILIHVFTHPALNVDAGSFVQKEADDLYMSSRRSIDEGGEVMLINRGK